MNIKTFVSPGFGENGYLVWNRGSSEAIAIDPGSDVLPLIAALQSEKLQLRAILLTHAHIDHLQGVPVLKRETNAPIHMHPASAPFYNNAPLQGLQFGVQIEPMPPVDHSLEGVGRLDIAGVEFEVRDVPGHCPGHVIFYSAQNALAFVGDVVFQGSIGRTDLPGGNYQQLMQSIRGNVMTLPDETQLYSGHGPVTTVGEERRSNPFIAPMYGGSFA